MKSEFMDSYYKKMSSEKMLEVVYRVRNMMLESINYDVILEVISKEFDLDVFEYMYIMDSIMWVGNDESVNRVWYDKYGYYKVI